MTNSFSENFFPQHGAIFTDGQISFGETPADVDRLTQQTTVSVLLTHGLVQIQSVDNLKFLQGQFTCDVKEVSREQWRYGALCTHQGRVIANFLLLQHAEHSHLLRLPNGAMEALQSTLKKFAPFYKATINSHIDDFVLLGVNGSQARALIATVFGSAPAVGHAVQTDTATVISLAEDRFECWINNDALATLWPQLITNATPTGCAYWQLLNIRAGLGEVRQPTVECWTPHMLNLQCVGAINFKKGCYTGQEIVARTEYRGHQKRAMYRFTGTGAAPEPATPVMDGEQQAGEIVMASACSHAQWEGLAVISEPHLAHELRCQQAPIERLELPYTVKSAHKA